MLLTFTLCQFKDQNGDGLCWSLVVARRHSDWLCFWFNHMELHKHSGLHKPPNRIYFLVPFLEHEELIFLK